MSYGQERAIRRQTLKRIGNEKTTEEEKEGSKISRGLTDPGEKKERTSPCPHPGGRGRGKSPRALLRK